MKWPTRQFGFASGTSLLAGRTALIAGTIVVVFFYAIAIFADLLATNDYRSQSRLEPMAPPSSLHFRDSAGNWQLRPFIYARRLVDPLERKYEENPGQPYRLGLFTRGYSYKLFGLFTTDLHLLGIQNATSAETPRLHLLGTDGLGRDRFSRLLIATRFSLLVGPLGTLLAGGLGILIGLVAGYSASRVDALLMRAADVMMALPTLILILAMRAAFPLELSPTRAAILLIIIFVILGWAEMARLARGLTLELRQREFTQAAVSVGCSPARVLFYHILPNASGPLITQLFLMLPAFLLAETSLSFLGVGLQEPEASWGNLLTEASNITLLERSESWPLLTPALAIIGFVFGIRLLGKGLESNNEAINDQAL